MNTSNETPSPETSNKTEFPNDPETPAHILIEGVKTFGECFEILMKGETLILESLLAFIRYRVSTDLLKLLLLGLILITGFLNTALLLGLTFKTNQPYPSHIFDPLGSPATTPGIVIPPDERPRTPAERNAS